MNANINPSTILQTVIGTAVIGLFVFVVTINATIASQEQINNSIINKLEEISSDLQTYEATTNQRFSSFQSEILERTDDRFSRKEAELNFEIIEQREKANTAQTKLWVMEQLEK